MNSRLSATIILVATLCATALVPLRAVDTPPRPVDRPAPYYPFELRKGQVEAQVTLLFTITADGRVIDAVVTESNNRLFRDHALAAVKNWRFAPALKDGRPVSVRAEQPFFFVVPEKQAARAVALAAAEQRAATTPDKPAESQ